MGLAALDLLQNSTLTTIDDRMLLDTLYRQVMAGRAQGTVGEPLAHGILIHTPSTLKKEDQLTLLHTDA